MGEGGRTCRKVDRGDGEPLDVEATDDAVRILRDGRVVRTVTGADADELRLAIERGDERAIARLVGRLAR